jgi:hypothetical protein
MIYKDIIQEPTASTPINDYRTSTWSIPVEKTHSTFCSEKLNKFYEKGR